MVWEHMRRKGKRVFLWEKRHREGRMGKGGEQERGLQLNRICTFLHCLHGIKYYKYNLFKFAKCINYHCFGYQEE